MVGFIVGFGLVLALRVPQTEQY